MRLETLTGNIDKTIGQMREQTGKQPGGPTGLCHLFVVGSLTGEDIDFISERETYAEQLEDERSAGLVRFEVKSRRTGIRTLPEVLQQNDRPFEAVFVSGTARTGSIGHMIAVVNTDVSPYCIVDSLLPGGIMADQSDQDVTAYVRNGFYPRSVELSMMVDQEENRRRVQRFQLQF